MTGIVSLSLVPLRISNSEQSEMCSQLLYGERVEILEIQDSWLYVRNCADGYVGWADRKMIYLLSDKEASELSTAQFKRVQTPLLMCETSVGTEKMLLPGGSLIPYVNGLQYQFGAKDLKINDTDVLETDATGERIISLAKQYLNTPYLWGGKSALGIDCSGLVQIVFAMCNIQLPRDANMQVEHGKTIDFLSEARAGDLAFFENAEGRIIHVGILLTPNKIIHASAWVKIDSIDAQGIISSQTSDYSHKLRIVKRIME